MGETHKTRFWMEPIWGLTLRFKHILERLFSDKPTNLKKRALAVPCWQCSKKDCLLAGSLACSLACLLACLLARWLAGSLPCLLAGSLPCLLACLPGHTSLRELSREKKTGGWEKNPSENNVPILSWHFILHSIWHSIWHLFWHSTILAFYYSVPFWHSICRSIWHSLLAFYLPFYLTFFAGILSGIYSDILLCSIPAF